MAPYIKLSSFWRNVFIDNLFLFEKSQFTFKICTLIQLLSYSNSSDHLLIPVSVLWLFLCSTSFLNFFQGLTSFRIPDCIQIKLWFSLVFFVDDVILLPNIEVSWGLLLNKMLWVNSSLLFFVVVSICRTLSWTVVLFLWGKKEKTSEKSFFDFPCSET